LWKQKGTSCRNLPQAYAIIEAWRAALSIVAPGVVLLAEAIESLDDVLPFFGKASKGCDLAYNNGVMTALWGSLADQDASLFAKVLAKAAQKPKGGAWLNYVRCHDDLIWNALSQDAPRQDLNRWSRFYGLGSGFSTGRAFQSAAGGVPSTNGMAASLVGLIREQGPKDAGVRRLIMLYGVIHALDGWPLVYMGDEIGLGNNTDYADDPLQALDGRWLHRPAMDWAAANLRKVKGSIEVTIFDAMAHFAKVARDLDAKGIGGAARPIALDPPELLAFVRDGGSRPFMCLANLSDQPVTAALPGPWQAGATKLLTGETVAGPDLDLAPYAVIWLAA
jgi:amylosucrase